MKTRIWHWLTSGRRRWHAAAWLVLLVVLAVPPALVAGNSPGGPVQRRQFFGLLHAGDSVYARKSGLRAMQQSLVYYDSALALAQRSQDTLLLAEAVFAKGRVYDAWNQQPQKTVAMFQQASDLFGHLPARRVRYLYARYLLAHAYDKVPDSTRAVQTLRALTHELGDAPDTLLRRLPFTVEMALVATQVRNYPLADSLLRQLTRRAWIRNDPATNDYLSHYYLVRARLAVVHERAAATPYLDSLRWAYGQATNPFDRFFYSRNLAELYSALATHAGQPHLAYDYLRISTDLADSLAAGGDAAQLRQALLNSEERQQEREQAYEAAARTTRWLVIGVLSAALLIISLLSFRLYRQRQASRWQADTLAVVNQQLDDKVAQVELLNKEIQHRVKNNLHMIFSLLHMQERRSGNAEVISNLQAARLRVESIAALHNQLLLSPDQLDLASYLRELISAVVSCLANDRQVITHLRTEALHLPTSAYLAVSLILNEWVTNSIKYAAPVGDMLEINLSVSTRPHDVCIAYADNGQSPECPAVTPGSAPRARPALRGPSGLGTQIIQLLTQQLDATLRSPDGHPYRYELCIPTDPDA